MPHSPLTRTYTLEEGPTVHLRLALRFDAAPVADLLRRRGVQAGDLEIMRALTYDPSCRAVVAALALIDGQETLVGLGAIELEPDALPDTLVADEKLAPGLGRLLGELLTARAGAHRRRVA